MHFSWYESEFSYWLIKNIDIAGWVNYLRGMFVIRKLNECMLQTMLYSITAYQSSNWINEDNLKYDAQVMYKKFGPEIYLSKAMDDEFFFE